MDVKSLHGKLGPMEAGLEAEVKRRIAEADKNNDGTLGSDEIISVVKNLVLEHRSTIKYKKATVVVAFLLLLSLVGNFGLAIWGNEISKETHVTPMEPAEEASAAATASDSDGGAVVASPPPPREHPAVTADDGETIVATASATQQVPLYVAPVMEADLLSSGEVEVTFQIYDEEAQPVRGEEGRQLQEAEAATAYKTQFLTVTRVDQISDTHVKFYGENGELLEVVDGEMHITTEENLADVLASSALSGSSANPTEPSAAGGGAVDLDKRVLVTRPVCGACSIRVPAYSANGLAEVAQLETRAVEALARRGIDVGDADVSGALIARSDARRRLATSTTKPPSFVRACESVMMTVLAPALEAVASVVAKANNAESEGKPCTLSTLGCVKITITHQGPMQQQMEEDGPEPFNQPLSLSNARRVRSLQEGEGRELTTELFVSEKIGAEGGEDTEVYYADAGVCGVKTMGDASGHVRAISFKPCDSDSWSKYYGAKGRAKAMASAANRPDRERRPAFVRSLTRRSRRAQGLDAKKEIALQKFSGLEDLTDNEEMYPKFESESPITSFRADLLSMSPASLKFKSKLLASGKMGSMLGNKPFPSANDDEYATLGTGLKGALIKSGDTLKSLAFVYTDACSQFVNDDAEYQNCKGNQ